MIHMEKSFIPVCQTPSEKKLIALTNPLVLSFVGDSVQTLYVRTKLCLTRGEKAGLLHKLAVPELKAAGQCAAMHNILPLLTEEESDIYKRARNAKSPSTAKNASVSDYRTASGFEALIGFLYLAGDTARLEELMNIAYPSIM